VKYRLLEISRAAKSKTDDGKQRLKQSYGKLLALTRRVTGQASKLLEQLSSEQLPVVGDMRKVIAQQSSLRHYLPLVKRVIAQTKQRLFGGNVHVADKVLSLFETHTQVIRKGKAHKPNEFGRLVRIDEVEGGIVSNYDVVPGNQADTDSFVPAIDEHIGTFGRAPNLVTADRGYFSADNENKARKLGVKKVAVPARGRLSNKRTELQKQRWFRRAMAWRAVIEGRIGTLKHRFGMLRAAYKGEAGFERYVGGCVIANNLVSIARRRLRRAG
jgi:IS5 family transposase